MAWTRTGGPVAKVCPRCRSTHPADRTWCPTDGSLLVDADAAARRCGLLLDARWRLHEVVAQGGFGTVYRGTDEVSGDPVAVKVLHPERARDPEFVQRFVREAHVLGLVQHKGLVGHRSQGHAPEAGWYLVLDWVGGQTMRDVLDEQQTLSWPQLDVLLTELLAAVQCLHDAEIIHRDIHVGNIHWLVEDTNPVGRPVLLDFGVARTLNPTDERLPSGLSELTRPRQVIGSPWSISPEQVLGGTVDARTDLYSVGVLLYECLTGQLPFQAERPGLIMRAHVYEPPPIPSNLRRDAPPACDDLVLRLLAKRADERPHSAMAVLQDWHQLRSQMPV